MEFFCESMTNQVIFGLSVKKASGKICVPCRICFPHNGEKVSVFIDNLSLKFKYSSQRLNWTVNYKSDEDLVIFIKKGVSDRCTPAYVYVPQVDDCCLTTDGEELSRTLSPTIPLANYTSLPDKEILDFVSKLKLRLVFMSNARTRKSEDPSEKESLQNDLPGISEDLRQRIYESSKKTAEEILKDSLHPQKTDLLKFQPDETTIIHNEFVEICNENGIVFHTKQIDNVEKTYGITTKFALALVLPAQVFKEITGFSTDKEKTKIYVYEERDHLVFGLDLLKFYDPISQTPRWTRFVEILKEKFTVLYKIQEGISQVDNNRVETGKRQHVIKVLELISSNWDLFHDYCRFIKVWENKCNEFEEFTKSNPTIPEAKDLAEAVKKCRLAIKLAMDYNNTLTGF